MFTFVPLPTYNIATTFGKKISSPTMQAPIATHNTAPAAASFVFLAKGWYSGDTKLVKCSIEVLKVSALNTKTIQSIIRHHSIRVSPI